METDVYCEPMDIDLSSQSVRDMDISYNEYDDDLVPSTRPSSRISAALYSPPVLRPVESPGIPSNVRKHHIIIQKPPVKKKNPLFKIVVTSFVVFASIMTYHVYSLQCCEQVNLEVLRETLSTKLYGQSAAVNLLIKTLELKAKSKILFFSGGTGVGKTFTSSLLLDTVGSYSNVYHYTMPTFENTFSTDLMFGLTMCKMSLIIVDDLTINDMNIKVQIKDVIDKSQNLEKEITVILIYNCNEDHKSLDKTCDKSFKSKLLDNFSSIKAHKRFIQFEPLSEKHLRECIMQELGNKKINDLEFENMLKNFNVSVDGCKGVHSKMKYLHSV